MKRVSYTPAAIESKWQKVWADKHVFAAPTYPAQHKKYILDMFPYPSGSGLHVGHPRGYIGTDVLARYWRAKGYSVLHPMGWDAFGLPAENYAIKTKTHPRITTERNIARYKEQLSIIGLSYDWDREIDTTDPKYYKWTQWIFLKLLEKGLAFESYEPINWCPSCKTGLANEDLENGVCERCGSQVEKKPMRQWVLRITDYAERLLADVDALDWPESIKISQRNWIGKSEGTEIDFKIADTDEKITVFTTRADTLFGVTYCVVAPEHPLIEKMADRITNIEEVREYVVQARNKTEIERTAEGKEKNGVCLQGVKVINPVNGESVPVFVGDYVLGDYGTGAVMAVPAHDDRDFAFAKKYQLPIRQVVKNDACAIGPESAMTEDGMLVAAGDFSGLTSEDAREKISAYLAEHGLGKKVIKYKLRDWVFSRQRYWGEPIPVVHCDQCGVVPVPENQLPVVLPDVESYEPTGTGESPLAGITDWVNTTCPRCEGPAKRETNTMPQWAGSSWYYLRYIDPHNDKQLIDPEKEKQWMPVDVYAGGAEHATRHLIYARFWHKFLYDIGIVSTSEPFAHLHNQGLIIAEDGRKMSKSLGNVINPDQVIADYGADSFRAYEMFMGPFNDAMPWSTRGIVGVRRFLEKVWKLILDTPNGDTPASFVSTLHRTIKKVTEDIEGFRFNTAISAMMILTNEGLDQSILSVDDKKKIVQLVAPFAPHMAEELWEMLEGSGLVSEVVWPEANPVFLQLSEVEVVVQFAGKTRGTVTLPAGADQETAIAAVKANARLMLYMPSETKKVIYVQDRILNIV